MENIYGIDRKPIEVENLKNNMDKTILENKNYI